MRQIISADPVPTFKFPSAWLVRFQDTSVVGVNVASYYLADVENQVRTAAARYSEQHSDGILESVMVDLAGVTQV